MELDRREALACGCRARRAAPSTACGDALRPQSLDVLARKSGRRFGSAVAWGPPGADRGSFANPAYARDPRARMRAARPGE